jgi:GNAT superfamily N-acetyltransferase
MKWPGPDGYWASDEHDLIDTERVHAWISRESYWAEGRPREAMVKAIQNSLVIGLYSASGTQVGFARFVTDYATFAWLCDVFVDSGHRGKRLGTFLVETAISHPGVRGLRQVLAAEPGRSLYARFGFRQLPRPERWMERPGLTP